MTMDSHLTEFGGVVVRFRPRQQITLAAKPQETVLTKTITTMKEWIDMLFDDNKSFDKAPWWVYAFICPLGLIALMAIAGTLS